MQTWKVLIGIPVLVTAIAGQLSAQSHPRKHTTVSHKTAPAKDDKATITVFYPDFLRPVTIYKSDTSDKYEYYDKNVDEINPFNLTDIDKVDQVKYFKIFSRYSKTQPGPISAPTEYMLQYEYVHPDHDLWMRHDLAAGEIVKYKMDKNIIVATDTVTLTDPVTKNQRRFINKYIKMEVESRHKVQSHEH